MAPIAKQITTRCREKVRSCSERDAVIFVGREWG